jgi:glycosyltransferase involved in cell wall biosynthesis
MTGKLRVLTIVAGLAIGERGGGAEKFGVELARSLDRSAFDPVVCGFWRRGIPVEEIWLQRLADDGIPAFFAADRSGRFSPRSYLRGLRQIVARMGEAPVHVIHSHYQLGSVAAPYLRPRLEARTLVRTAHGPVFEEWGHSATGWVLRLLFTQGLYPVVFHAEAGVSQQIVESLDRRPLARALGKRAFLLHNAIAVRKGVSGPDVVQRRTELGLPQASMVVGSIGRLAEQKGYRYLLEAIPAVLASRPGVRFVLIGDGELRASLQALAARLGIAEQVLFAGLRPNAELYYPAMDLFVLPSIWEGLPTVVLESMASGVSVVASDIAGVRELVQAGATGWLAPPANPGALAKAILDALARPDKRAEFAERAAREVLPNYTLERVARGYEDLYRKLVMISGDR